MARNKIISKEARAHVVEQLRESGEMTKSEIMELLRPHCSFDLIALQEQALGRLASGVVHSIRDESGARTAFIARGSDSVINIETCRDFSKISAVELQLAKQLEGLTTSHRKAQRRKQELTGQVTFDDFQRVAGEVAQT